MVPEGVSDVLSYFFPSKLQHMLLTDVISLYSETTIDAHFAATGHVMKGALAAAAAAAAHSTASPPPTVGSGSGLGPGLGPGLSARSSSNNLYPAMSQSGRLDPPSEKDNDHSMLDEASYPLPAPSSAPAAPPVSSGIGIGITRVGRLRLPQQYPVNAVMMPVRTGAYLSFTRYGRVIERMIDVYDQQLQQQQLQQHQLQQHSHTANITIDSPTTTAPLLPTPHTLPCTQQPWSLAFRDSNYGGDFHVSLLNTLRRCGRLVSVTFANSNKVPKCRPR